MREIRQGEDCNSRSLKTSADAAVPFARDLRASRMTALRLRINKLSEESVWLRL
jgi:hypothetical protein